MLNTNPGILPKSSPSEYDVCFPAMRSLVIEEVISVLIVCDMWGTWVEKYDSKECVFITINEETIGNINNEITNNILLIFKDLCKYKKIAIPTAIVICMKNPSILVIANTNKITTNVLSAAILLVLKNKKINNNPVHKTNKDRFSVMVSRENHKKGIVVVNSTT